MERVGIGAYGITPFAKEGKNVEDLLFGSVRELFKNNPQVDKKCIDTVLVSTNSNSKYLAAIVSEMSGITPKTTHSIENLCSSGTNSIVSAYSYIVSGLADMVLVAGAEMHDSPGQVLDWDISRGKFNHPIFWGSLFTKAYKREFSVSEEEISMVSVKNHKQAQNNPNALSKKKFRLEDVLSSKKITDELRLLDCSRSCAGSASVILASERIISDVTDLPVWISGIGQKTTSAGFTKNMTLSRMDSSAIAGSHALKMAGRDSGEIDVAEVHDAFSVCEPMALEALGICKPGEGTVLTKELHETENFKINPRGGLIGCGHPLGATGIAQTIEITQQLRSEAGPRQTDMARTGLVHNMSAAATSSTVLVLEK